MISGTRSVLAKFIFPKKKNTSLSTESSWRRKRCKSFKHSVQHQKITVSAQLQTPRVPDQASHWQINPLLWLPRSPFLWPPSINLAVHHFCTENEVWNDTLTLMGPKRRWKSPLSLKSTQEHLQNPAGEYQLIPSNTHHTLYGTGIDQTPSLLWLVVWPSDTKYPRNLSFTSTQM